MARDNGLRVSAECCGDCLYLLSIGERAETIAEAFEQRLSSTQEALLELIGVVEELEKAEERRRQSDLPDEAFSTLIFLENSGVESAKEVAGDSSTVFENNPHWKDSAEQEKQVRMALYKALMKSEPKRMVDLVDGLITTLKRASRS